MPLTTRSPRVRAVAALCAFGLLTAACGDDDDTDAATEDTAAEGEAAGSEDFTEYCAATAELDEQDGPPTVEQMENIKELRPDEIGEEVDFAADAIIGADGDLGKVFSDPEFEERIGVIEEWEGENCPDGGDEAAVAPEFAEYCEKVGELDEQDGPPSAEQIEGLRAVAPDEIAEEVDVVAEAFAAADGDMGKAFSDPAVEEAFGPIEEFEAENCGGGDEEENEDEEVATEPLEGAQVFPVTAVDFAFEGIPAEVPAGDVSFELTNEGESAHEMAVFRLGEGVDLDELLSRDEEPSEEEALEVGGTFAAPGEGGAYFNAEGLEPGTYAVVCFIPGPEGKAHHELGMKTTFTVG